MSVCYDCGHDDADDERSWWSLRPRPIRNLRWRAWRRLRPFRAWWYAPILRRTYLRREGDDACYETLRPARAALDWRQRLYLFDVGGEPWEYVDPNPMPAFRLWRLWPGAAAQSPPGPPLRWSDFLPDLTAMRGGITFVRPPESAEA